MVRARTARPDVEHSQIDERGLEFIKLRHRFPANGLGFLLAPLLWIVYFVTIYSLHGVGCAAGLDGVQVLGVGALRLALAALTALFVGGIVAAGAWSYAAWRRLLRELEDDERKHDHSQSTFLAYGALLLAGLFLIATLWSGIPVLLLESCDNLGST